MRILIVGAGLTGCTLAFNLKKRGHDVEIIEKEKYVGGLCLTLNDPSGMRYEVFGPHTFHTTNNEIVDFVTSFSDFTDYTHKKGMLIEGCLYPFPLAKDSVDLFPDSEIIREELKNLPEKTDMANFETACISIFGNTLYNKFIRNYSLKMWGSELQKLSANWAPKRLFVVEKSDIGVFPGEWQGQPKTGYSGLFSEMIKNIPIRFETDRFEASDYDVVAYSGRIDELHSFCFGELPYRSSEFHLTTDEEWESMTYGTINLPDDPEYIRKCNFKVLHQVDHGYNLVQYQKALPLSPGRLPMYPIPTQESKEIFHKYLEKTCESNICPVGRLGLYEYLNMDTAMELAFDTLEIIENYPRLEKNARLDMFWKMTGQKS